MLRRFVCWMGVPALGLLAAGGTGACGSGDCSSEIEDVRRFLHDHRTCETDDDCVAVRTACHTFANGICAQAPLNRAASESSEWQKLSRALGDCQGECSICFAAIEPGCTDGLCGPPP